MIEINSLTRVYGKVVGIEDLSFNVNQGEIFALLGPNGSGKTTTLRLMEGLIGPTNGYVSIDGLRTDNQKELSSIHGKIGVLPENAGLYENLTAFRNLQFYGRMYGMDETSINTRVKDLLTEFGLWDDRERLVGTYSKGMKQKLAIVRSVIHDPEYLFLDEPLSGLDPEAARDVREFMLAMRKGGKTIILSTHDLQDADRLSDRVAVVKNRLLAIDNPSSLKKKAFNRSVVFHLSKTEGLNLEEIEKNQYVKTARIVKDSLVLEVESPEENNPELVRYLVNKGYDIQFIGEIRHSLEDVYLSIVDKSRKGEL